MIATAQLRKICQGAHKAIKESYINEKQIEEHFATESFDNRPVKGLGIKEHFGDSLSDVQLGRGSPVK